MSQEHKTIHIEIWSDIACPFCYIGNKNLSDALEQFDHAEDVSIEYKSYQLSPNAITDPSINSHQYLAKHKGISVQEAEQMNKYVEDMGSNSGLNFKFDKVIPANTLNAHKLLHYAKEKGKQLAVKKALFEAHFIDGLNIDDPEVLSQIAIKNGLDNSKLKAVLESSEYDYFVKTDITEANAIGVRGVPFFVINRKYGVSGAQPVGHFTEILDKTYSETLA